tara:strand:- start:202 stop:669 length:468 start_codon:yes stop_codon:yes gene_type:complete
MAYEKLQVSRAILVATSDTVDLPSPSAGLQSGAATGTTADKLVFATGAFTSTVKVGFIVINTTDNTTAYVSAVDSDTQLSLSVDIMASAENFVIYGEATNNGAVLYVGGAGNVRVLTAGSDDVTFTGVNAGTFLPIQVLRVYSTSTTATTILALW